MLGAIPMTSQAAPIAPLTGIAVSHDNLAFFPEIVAGRGPHQSRCKLRSTNFVVPREF
jgi:hypothetical protein